MDEGPTQLLARSKIHQIERLPVPGGWLYTVLAFHPSQGGGVACSSTFVPEDRPALTVLPFPPTDNRAEQTVSIPPADPMEAP